MSAQVERASSAAVPTPVGMPGGGLLATALVCCALSPAGANAASAPSASTGGASNVTFSSAVLHGSVNPGGAATNFAFQYGTSRRYEFQTPLAAAGSGTTSVKVSEAVKGLRPNTTYHYRLVAFGIATATGRDRTFKTSKVPLSLAIAGVPNPVTFGAAFLLEGTLSGTGAGGRAVVLKANPFPYTGGFKPLANRQVTSPTGTFSFFVPGLALNTQLRVFAVGKPAISSPVLVESVAVRVAFHIRHTRRRGYVRMSGTVAPAEVGSLVGFQRLKPGHHSVNEGGTAVVPGTPTVARFSRVIHIRHHGLFRALVKTSDPSHVSGYSAPVLVR
ncbi:MAG: hypothetical protein E6G34_13965 [Actinobacteria bacterium]|nr:MAG: hypothetical protein E6G34_13965 [Actinomycetota bacterium]